MSGIGSALGSGGGLEALLKAAKFIEGQEKRKPLRQPSVLRQNEEVLETKEAVCQKGVQILSNSSCIPTPPLPRHGSVIREVHNKLEKTRRAQLKESFAFLKKQLPHSDDKASNLSILYNAIQYIHILKRREREFEHEMERLIWEKIAYQQRLVTLKKELTAQWEHIDFNMLLPEVVEPELRKTCDCLNGRVMDAVSKEEMVHTCVLYSSTVSSLSSASPLHSYSIPHHAHQAASSPGSPSLLTSPIQQLLPSTTIQMLPADTHFVHSHIPTTKNSTLVTTGLLNHSLVVPQSNGQSLLAVPPRMSEKVRVTPVLKSISQVPLQPQILVKPTIVVVSAAANTPN